MVEGLRLQDARLVYLDNQMKKSNIQIINEVRGRVSFWGIYNTIESTERLKAESNVLWRGQRS